MAAKRIRRMASANLLALFAGMQSPRPLGGADLPTSPGVGFAVIGIARGQAARMNALNAGPGGPALPSGRAQGSCGGGITFEFYGSDGELLKRSVLNSLAPG